MIIGVDAGCLGVKDERLKVGVYQVVKNLFEELAKLDRKNVYLLYSFYPIDPALMTSFGNNVRNIIVRPMKGWLKIWLPLQIMQDNIDIFFALNQAVPFQVPFTKQYRVIGIVYDIAFEKFPLFFSSQSSVRQLHRITTDLCRCADTLIAISEATKHDLCELYRIPYEKITVIYPGFRSKLSLSLPSFTSRRPYFLFVGAFKKMKNIPGIIHGFVHFMEKARYPYDLRLVGGDKWIDTDIQKTLDEIPLKYRKRIHLMGFVSDALLVSLYKGAVAFVSPSYYEGFGLPFLEAMRLGCPVIGSSVGSLPEVIGEAGILVDPYDSESIGRAMVRMLDNKIRNEYISKGRKQAKRFSNRLFAKEIFKVILR